jgi:hypothetical protein
LKLRNTGLNQSQSEDTIKSYLRIESDSEEDGPDTNLKSISKSKFVQEKPSNSKVNLGMATNWRRVFIEIY